MPDFYIGAHAAVGDAGPARIAEGRDVLDVGGTPVVNSGAETGAWRDALAFLSPGLLGPAGADRLLSSGDAADDPGPAVTPAEDPGASVARLRDELCAVARCGQAGVIAAGYDQQAVASLPGGAASR